MTPSPTPSTAPTTNGFGVGFDQAVIGMATATPTGELTFLNQAMQTILPDAAPERLLSDLFAAADRTAIREAVVEAKTGEVTPLVVETTAGRRTLLVVSPVTVSGDSVSYLLIQTLDVNKRHRLHEQVSDLLEKATDRSRLLSNTEQLAGVGSFVWDIRLDSFTWSEGLSNVLGIEPGNFAGTWEAFLERVHPDDRDVVSTALREAVRSGGRWQLDERILRPDGTVRVIASSGTAIVDDNGRVVRVQGVCHDVTEQRAAQEALRVSEESFRHGFDDAPIGIALLDPIDGPWRIIRCNHALARLLDLTPDELADRTLTDFATTTEAELLKSAWAHLVDGTRSTVHREVRLRRRSGDVRMVLTSASRMSLDNGSADPLIVHIEDVTARKVAEAELRHRALHDSLTGLPNRALLLDRLERALEQASQSGTVVGLLYCGIDDFKLINDTLGHAAGDQLLRTIGGRLRRLARAGDTVARLSGDEFVLVIDALPSVDALMPIVSRAHSVLAQPVQVQDNEVHSTASIGLSVGSGIGDIAEDLVRDADMAMHRAKQRGKNTYELFDDTLRRSALQRLEVEQQLRIACAEHQFVVHYQPVVSVHSGALVGFEALLRWEHPHRGVLAPAEFFSVVEDTDMVRVVGQQVLDAACRQLVTWQRQLPNLRMAVNVSGRQLDGTFAEMVEATLKETGAAAATLDLEVTETVLVDMAETTSAELRALDRLGVRLGIDDFGTGYSSMSYLKRLPVRFIKVDRSFVHDMDANDEDAAIVEAVVGLGDALSLSVTAEGVESTAQLATLDRLGCASAQGYLFSAPCDAPTATALVERWERL
jgi:diguanylate cyclase (GGDEF)-like protein/PAS domain S-box-containing protein